jgi:hypothetical protein
MFASLGFTPIVIGFTPQTQLASVLVTNPPISRSLSATFSELTGQPTPPKFWSLATTSVVLVTEATGAPVTGTTETIPPSVASFEPPQIAILEALATQIEALVATLPTGTPLEPQGQATAIVLDSTSQLAGPVIETVVRTDIAPPIASKTKGQ